MLCNEGSFLGEGLLDTGELCTLVVDLLPLRRSACSPPDLEVDSSPLGGGGSAFLDLLDAGNGGGTLPSIEDPETDILSTLEGNAFPLNVASTPKTLIKCNKLKTCAYVTYFH